MLLICVQLGLQLELLWRHISCLCLVCNWLLLLFLFLLLSWCSLLTLDILDVVEIGFNPHAILLQSGLCGLTIARHTLVITGRLNYIVGLDLLDVFKVVVILEHILRGLLFFLRFGPASILVVYILAIISLLLLQKALSMLLI